VITDWFSKFSALLSVRAAESESLCAIVEDRIFLVNGAPEVLVSDNGSQFVGKPFQELVRKYDVRHFKNSVYHPQSNPAERVNKVVKVSIRCYVDEDQRN
jgi:transposase InsO family protein